MVQRVLRSVLAVACAAAVFLALTSRTLAQDVPAWRTMVDAPPPTAEQALTVAGWVGRQLFDGSDEPLAADAFGGDDAAVPRAVFVSVSNGERPAVVAVGLGDGLGAAAADAASRAAMFVPDVAQRAWVRVDVVNVVEPLSMRSPTDRLPIDPAGWGVVLDDRVPLLPDELVLNRLIERERLARDRVARHLARQPGRSAHGPDGSPGALAPRARFSTHTFFLDANDPATIVPLVRGHRTFGELTRDDLIIAAEAAGRYLTGAVGPDGRFVYSYDAGLDREADDYNVLRHSGTVWSMLDLYSVNGDAALLDASRRALDWVMDRAKPALDDPERLVVVDEVDEVKLGGNALTALALGRYIEVTNDRSRLPELRKLGRSIVAAQSTAGRFVVQKQNYHTGHIFPLDSVYYPGQAILALVQLHRLDPDDPAWLNAARRAAAYQVTIQQAVPAERLEHDHWLMYALAALHRESPEAALVAHARTLARQIVAAQHTPDTAPTPDLAGSWRDGDSTPAATRAEGLLAVIPMLRGATARDAMLNVAAADPAADALDSVRRSVRFQLTTQIRPEQAMSLPDPQRSLGGFRDGLDGTEVRIDYVQHNLSALLDLLRLIEADSAGDTGE